MRPVFAFDQRSRILHALSAVSAAAMLVACGGEGEGSIAAGNGSEVLLKAREAVVVPGTLESVKYRLKTLSWSIRPLAASNPDLRLSNLDCAVALKNDMSTPTPATSNSPAGSGGSSWQCNLVVVSEKNVTTDALYELLLSGTHETGQLITTKRLLRVLPNPAWNSLDPDIADLKDLSIQPVATVCQPGSPIELIAQGIDIQDPGIYYRWSVIQGPPLVLAGASTPRLGLSTPMVAEPTLSVVQLEASKSPITSQTPVLVKAIAVINSNPTYPFPYCSARQQPKE